MKYAWKVEYTIGPMPDPSHGSIRVEAANIREALALAVARGVAIEDIDSIGRES